VNIGAGDQFKPEFLAISPNNRMPAIVDPEGPDGNPISVFESGAILQYLARKTGRFYGGNERERVEVEQWLMWQVGGVGPMAGQAHHFLTYAPSMDPPNDLPYAKDRYRNEVERLYGVLDKRLADRDFVAGEYSIADMAIWPWASLWEGQRRTSRSSPTWRPGWSGWERGPPFRRAARWRPRRAPTSQPTRRRRRCCSDNAQGAEAADASSRPGACLAHMSRKELRGIGVPATRARTTRARSCAKATASSATAATAWSGVRPDGSGSSRSVRARTIHQATDKAEAS
jgi:glutathione S-transferase